MIIETKFNIGDKVFVAIEEEDRLYILNPSTCTKCNGQSKVIKDGVEYICSNCRNMSSAHKKDCVSVIPVERHVNSIEIYTDDEVSIFYTLSPMKPDEALCCNESRNENEIFATEEECQEYCDKINNKNNN